MDESISLDEGGSRIVVIRPGVEVEVRKVSAGSLTFLRRLASADTIADAYAQAALIEPEFDLNAFLPAICLMGHSVPCEIRNLKCLYLRNIFKLDN
jgi:hypothetical protein